MRIRVRATANVLGLVRGDEAWIEVGPLVDGLVEDGTLLWLDPPPPTFRDYEVTDAVKARVAGEIPEDAGVETELSVEPASDPIEAWVDEGGYSGESY